MKSFYAFDTKGKDAVRIAVVGDKLYEMTENKRICEADVINDLVYLGEDGDLLLPSTILNTIGNLAAYSETLFSQRAEEFVQRLKRWELRCDPDHDTCEIVVRLTENYEDDWTLEMVEKGCHYEFIALEEVGYEFAKAIARIVIESAIALGIDIRTTWEFHRLETETETKNQKQDE